MLFVTFTVYNMVMDMGHTLAYPHARYNRSVSAQSGFYRLEVGAPDAVITYQSLLTSGPLADLTCSFLQGCLI